MIVAVRRFLTIWIGKLQRGQGQKMIPRLIFDFSDLHISETNNS